MTCRSLDAFCRLCSWNWATYMDFAARDGSTKTSRATMPPPVTRSGSACVIWIVTLLVQANSSGISCRTGRPASASVYQSTQVRRGYSLIGNASLNSYESHPPWYHGSPNCSAIRSKIWSTWHDVLEVEISRSTWFRRQERPAVSGQATLRECSTSLSSTGALGRPRTRARA